ncbi:unnamed protein product [Fraxinus pennsylvanica]|uniref:Uncharacterized protein n=1 Tax=Fraxinus pennsylvanica TaxID=56036 RepID=A0AAD2E4H2_9LAMI|nr:unnamed protein product [Fraxinus pennsylvanica]
MAETCTKSQATSLFLFLLFIVPLSARRINSQAILEVSLASQGRVVNQSTTKFHSGATTSPPNSTTRPPPAAGGNTTARSTNREFQATAHEVPSGPSPIGNG